MDLKRALTLKIGAFLATSSLLTTAASVANADPIYLQPGQCILVGSQQVCAMKTDAVEPKVAPQTLYVCRYGMHSDSEVPDLKSYSLVQIITSSSGVKSEVKLKNFGQNGGEACEREAKERATAKP